MRIRGLRAILAALAVLSLAGCGEDENPLTGSYAGTARATQAGQTLVVQLAVTLSQSGDSLSGGFVATDPAGEVDRGSVSGSVRGSAVSLSFRPAAGGAGACPATSESTFSGNRISGPMQITCPGQPPFPGTLELTKR
jgi:hypothetical protein